MTEPEIMQQMNPNGLHITVNVKQDMLGNIRRDVTVELNTFDVTDIPYIIGKCEALVKGEEV